MIGDGEAMSLIADHLQQAENQRMRVEIYWFMLSSFDQQISNFVMAQRWLDHSDHRYGFQIEFTHRVASGTKLALAAVNHDEIRQWLSFIQYSSITTKDSLAH